MTDQVSKTAATTVPADTAIEAKKMLRADIGGKWSKFSSQELTDLRDNDHLVSELVARYGLEKDAATRDAAAVVKGRSF